MALREERQWAMYVHLSALCALAGVPAGFVLGPLLLWQYKKDAMPALDAHGKDAINFQLAMTIYMVIAGIFTVFCFVGVIPLLGLGVYSMVMSVINGIAASEGRPYRYPGTIRFLQ